MRLRGHDTHLVRHKSKETLDAEVDKSDAGGQGAPSSQELQRDAGTGTGTPWEPACERQHDERQHDGHQPDGRQRNERPKPAYLERSILRRPDASRGKLQDATLANQQNSGYTRLASAASSVRSRAPDPDPAWEAVNRVLDNKMTALDRAYADRTRPPPPPSFFAPAPTPPKFQHPRSPYAPSTVPAADEFTRDLMRPPKYGGHSKRDQLGSIAESWGPDPADELRIGLFQQGAEPPSPPLGARR